MKETAAESLLSMEGLRALYLSLIPLLPTYAHLLASALFPIYTGAHASLSCPSSAEKPARKSKRREDDLDEDDEPVVQKLEGMTTSDALVLPLFAGVMLTGLYFLIKWLEDPALLNKILNLYFAGFSVFSVARLVSDGLDVAHSLVFPRRYMDQGQLWEVKSIDRMVMPVDNTTAPIESRSNPLPGPLGRLNLSPPLLNTFWFLKTFPHRKVTLKLHLPPLLISTIKLSPHSIIGIFTGVTAVLYYNLISKPWPLTNLFGFGFAYGAFQLMSPSSFSIASLLLLGLFFYDIYMVFFTPMMVSVAKHLEIPVKLEFPRPGPGGEAALAMLGLGDVVVPGLVVGLALRFDLWVHYLKKQRTVGERLKVGKNEEVKSEGLKMVKEEYVRATGRWGDRLWTSSGNGAASRTWDFPKTYFSATLFGYVIGMLTTLLVMQVSDHAQPALLYLVPGVLGSLWTTAWARGEFKLLLDFTEADEEEEKQQLDQAKREALRVERKAENIGQNMWDYAAGMFGATEQTNAHAKGRWLEEKSEQDNADSKKEKDTSKDLKVSTKDAHEASGNEEKPDGSRRLFELSLSKYSIEVRLPPPLTKLEVLKKKEQ